MAEALVSATEAEYIRRGFEDGLRADGRGCMDFRQIEIDTGMITQATGSARVRLGSTDVLVGVKAEVGAPDVAHPNWGRISFSSEFSPLASPAFRGRGGDDLARELTAMLRRSFFPDPKSNRGGLDLTTLCIVPGKCCWVLNLDILVLAMGGSVPDAASIAVKAALATSLLPKVELVAGQEEGDEPDYEIDDDPSVSVSLDVGFTPLILTVGCAASCCCLDLTLEEEACCPVAVSVGVDAQGQFAGLTKRQEGGLSPDELLDVLDVVQRRGPELHAAVDTYLRRIRA